MQGLQDVIGLSVTHPTWRPTRPGQDEHCGWAFAAPEDPPLASSTGYGSFPCDGCIPDTGGWGGVGCVGWGGGASKCWLLGTQTGRLKCVQRRRFSHSLRT